MLINNTTYHKFKLLVISPSVSCEQRENKHLIETNMRLEQENDDLAHELMDSKLSMKSQIEAVSLSDSKISIIDSIVRTLLLQYVFGPSELFSL